MAQDYSEITQAIIGGKMDEVGELIQQALEEGSEAGDILNIGMIPAMEKVGVLFEQGEYYVPEMLISARAMQGGLDILRPLLQAGGVESVGKVVIGTVQGDLHDIGKNLVGLMLEGAGYEINDLGTDVSPESFVAAVKEAPDCILALSALLTTTMTYMKSTIEALDQAGVRNQVKVIIGGAPVTSDYAEEIGADGYAPDASQAVKLTKSLT
jgi:5-methyltetrahydrofolate--homocysteine methyltransferase